jgi:hypothetical protein
MRGKKLLGKEKLNKRIIQALSSIRKLEKYYSQEILSVSCQRYVLLFRDKRKALKRKKELEAELQKLKGKI